MERLLREGCKEEELKFTSAAGEEKRCGEKINPRLNLLFTTAAAARTNFHSSGQQSVYLHYERCLSTFLLQLLASVLVCCDRFAPKKKLFFVFLVPKTTTVYHHDVMTYGEKCVELIKEASRDTTELIQPYNRALVEEVTQEMATISRTLCE